MKWFSRKLKLSLQLPSILYLTSNISWQVEARLNHFAPGDEQKGLRIVRKCMLT